MSPLTLRTDFGCTEAVIDDDCGLKRFYEVANILSDDLDIKFTQKTDDFDSLMWDFLYKGHILTLHYNIYTGISIYPRKFREAPRKDNDAVVEVAKFLESKLLINTARRYSIGNDCRAARYVGNGARRRANGGNGSITAAPGTGCG